MLLLAMLPAEEDREIFTRFYEKTCSTLIAVARQELGNFSQAEDVVQSVYAELIQRYRGNLAALDTLGRGYLILLTRWRARDFKRRERRLVCYAPEQWDSVLEEAPDRMEETLAAQEQVDWLLDSLSSGYRALLELRLVLGLSNREAARRLGIRENTASVRYRRALEELKRKLEEVGEEP